MLQAKTPQPGVYLEDLCFQCQQATEKSLKALLLAHGDSFPRTHDLARLLGIAAGLVEEVPDHVREAARLTDYAVEARYPGVSEPVEQEEYEEAVKLAEGVVKWVERNLPAEPQAPSGTG